MRFILLFFSILFGMVANSWSQNGSILPGYDFKVDEHPSPIVKQKLYKLAAIEDKLVFTPKVDDTNTDAERGLNCLSFVGGPYFDLETPPCEASCGSPVAAGFQVWGNEAYVVEATAGSQYVFQFCSGYSAANWPAIITVAEFNGFNGAIPGTILASESGCSITFTTPSDKKYIIIVTEETDCGGPYIQMNNGFVTLDCGPNGANCYACTAGTLSNTGYLEVCPGDVVEIGTNNDQLIPTSGGYGWNFVPGPSGTGGPFNGSSFSFGEANPTGNLWGNDLDGSLGSSILQGSWIINGFTYEDENNVLGSICESTPNSVTVNFLNALATPCLPPDTIGNLDTTGAFGICTPPYNLNIITRWPDTAIVSWDGVADVYDIVIVNLSNGEVFDGTPTDTNVTSPDTITGLQPETLYSVYVRGRCYGTALLISGVIDATLPPDGLPKAIELYALSDIDDLSRYGVGSANNGEGSDGEEYSLSGTAVKGEYLYVTSSSDEFDSWFGFAPNFVNSVAEINGDDAIELFHKGEVIDVFGEINVDGTGEPWEYRDGWAYRKDSTGPDGSTFVLDNWFFSGAGGILATDTFNATCNFPAPFGTYVPSSSSGGTSGTGGSGGGGNSAWNYDQFNTFFIDGGPPCLVSRRIDCTTNIDVDLTDAEDDTAPAGCGFVDTYFWYRFTGDGLPWKIIATAQSSDMIIQILQGDCDTLICLEEAIDSLIFPTVVGEEYLIRVGSNTGLVTFNLNIVCSPPINDECEGVATIRVGGEGTCNDGVGFVSGNTIDGTNSGVISCDTDNKFDLWYKFTANAEAIKFNSIVGDPGIEIFDGTCDSLGSSIGCIDNESGIINGLVLDEEYFAVVWTNEQETSVEFCLEKFIPEILVANDTCSGAITVDCNTDMDVDGTLATINGTPGRACSGSGAGLWYTFEGDGQTWSITVTPQSTDLEIQLYTGGCDNLICEREVNNSALEETLEVSTMSGTTYLFYVAGANETRPDIGQFHLSISCSISVPINDTCEGAEVLVIGANGTCDEDGGFISTTTLGANQTAFPSCDGTENFDLWYTFVATSETITFNAITGNPGLAVFEGNCNSVGASLGCLNNISGHITGLTVGHTYFALVWTDNEEALVEFCLEEFEVPINDRCQGALALSCDNTVYGSTFGASSDASLTNCAIAINTAPGVWYTYLSNGEEVIFSLCDDTTDFNTQLAVFEGTCDNLVCVDANDDACGTASMVAVNTVNGNNYYIYITGSGASAGTFGLSVTSPSGRDSITFNIETCNPDAVGSEVEILTNEAGCDSVITTNHILVSNYLDTVYQTTCQSSAVGEVVDTIQSSDGCDSITVTITELIPTVWDTIETYTCLVDEVGAVSDTFVAFSGCDSIVVSITGLSPEVTTSNQIFTCIANETGISIDTLTASNGCDSIVITAVELLPESVTSFQYFTCNPDEAGITIDSSQAINGCDSISITTITLLSDTLFTNYLWTCDSNETGITTDTLMANAGCDSVVVTITGLLSDTSFTNQLFTCDVNEVDVFTDTLVSSGGCDSILVTTISLSESDSIGVLATSCNPDDIGIETVVLTNSIGCDSIVTTITTFGDYLETYIRYTCVEGEAGVTIDTFIIEDNCDSIVQVTTIFDGVIAVFDYFMIDTSIQFFNESQNADDYLWLFGDGMTSNINNPSHYYPQSGGYGVQLIASNEYCSDTLFKAIEVSFPTGIDLNHHFENIVLYPNPNNGTFEVELKSNDYSALLELTLYSLSGMRIDSRVISFNKYAREVYSYSELPAGSYLLQIQDGKNRLVLKIKVVR